MVLKPAGVHSMSWKGTLRRNQLCLDDVLPLVRWRDAEQLGQLMEDCRAAGAVLFNPHVLTVEDGGLGVVDADQVAAKQRFDPSGLLNPGKLRGWLERN